MPQTAVSNILKIEIQFIAYQVNSQGLNVMTSKCTYKQHHSKCRILTLRKIVIKIGKKKKRKPDSSEEESDDDPPPRHTSRDDDSVSSSTSTHTCATHIFIVIITVDINHGKTYWHILSN